MIKDINKCILKDTLTKQDTEVLLEEYNMLEIEKNVSPENNIFIKIESIKKALVDLEELANSEFKDYGFYSIDGYFESCNDFIRWNEDIEFNNLVQRSINLLAVDLEENIKEVL